MEPIQATNHSESHIRETIGKIDSLVNRWADGHIRKVEMHMMIEAVLINLVVVTLKDCKSAMEAARRENH